LGQGDTDPRVQPRLLEKLKGVKIHKVFAFNNRSFAVDINGLLYAWGKDFGLFPQPSKYFQIQDVQSIVDVAVCDYENYENHRAKDENTIPDGTVFYLTRFGEVFYSNAKHQQPLKLLATYDHFVVQVVAGAGHALFLTDKGEVYALYRPLTNCPAVL
jgi:alpha-tubulin suppressor-like RCC1 family protein